MIPVVMRSQSHMQPVSQRASLGNYNRAAVSHIHMQAGRQAPIPGPSQPAPAVRPRERPGPAGARYIIQPASQTQPAQAPASQVAHTESGYSPWKPAEYID